MPRKKLPDFVCPRCGYTTPYTTCIQSHLYKTKKPCPATASDIELSDFIKKRVMNDRVFSNSMTDRFLNDQINKAINAESLPIVAQANQVTNNITNNNIQTIDNSVHYNLVIHQHLMNQPMLDNLSLYSQLKKIPFDTLENRAKIACGKLGWYDVENDKIKDAHHVIKDETCKDLFETITTKPSDKIACIIKQPNSNLYSVHDGDKFVTQSELETMQKTIMAVKQVFFDDYEKTLIKKKDDDTLDSSARLRFFNILKAYYALLNAFDLLPSSTSFDDEVWTKMLSENNQEKILKTREQFSEIMRSNSQSCQKHYKELLHQFFNKMIVNVTCP